MSINGTYHARVHAVIALALLAAAIAMASCGTVGPDESKWQDVSQFTTNAQVGDTVRFVYRKFSRDTVYAPDTLSMVTVDSMVSSAIPYADGSFSSGIVRRLTPPENKTGFTYLVNGDTLVMYSSKLPIWDAIVAPMQQGRSWNCAFINDSTPNWSATITNRYGSRNVGGVTYDNVLEIEYRPIEIPNVPPPSDNPYSWVCFFAQHVGLVEVRHYTISIDQNVQTRKFATEYERWTLLDLRRVIK